uniref:Uncharacterized protein n=1 Tax=Arundo donax TaxID=35708 RepID=A0A0A9D7N3_ARUDO
MLLDQTWSGGKTCSSSSERPHGAGQDGLVTLSKQDRSLGFRIGWSEHHLAMQTKRSISLYSQ